MKLRKITGAQVEMLRCIQKYGGGVGYGWAEVMLQYGVQRKLPQYLEGVTGERTALKLERLGLVIDSDDGPRLTHLGLIMRLRQEIAGRVGAHIELGPLTSTGQTVKIFFLSSVSSLDVKNTLSAALWPDLRQEIDQLWTALDRFLGVAHRQGNEVVEWHAELLFPHDGTARVQFVEETGAA